jgi:hypothetical protein
MPSVADARARNSASAVTARRAPHAVRATACPAIATPHGATFSYADSLFPNGLAAITSALLLWAAWIRSP